MAAFVKTDPNQNRIVGLDVARGVAIALMVTSHNVKALLFFKHIREMTDGFELFGVQLGAHWGVVPVHLITKFSSSLFVFVFGVGMAVAYFNKFKSRTWWKTGLRMLFRGLLIMFWYKVLTVVQMFEYYDREAIIDTLWFRRFPDFVEILQFYGWMLLILPFIMPFLARLSFFHLIVIAYAVGVSSFIIREYVDFGDWWQLQAILVEKKRQFTFGILSRGALALAGMAVGSLFVNKETRWRNVKHASIILMLAGAATLALFFAMYWGPVDAPVIEKVLDRLARNTGKHPPTFRFVSFSLGGAFLVLGFFLLLPRVALALFWPLRVIGSEALWCFNAHILIIYLVYRHHLGLRHAVTYEQALWLTGLTLSICVGTAWLNTQRKQYFPFRPFRWLQLLFARTLVLIAFIRGRIETDKNRSNSIELPLGDDDAEPPTDKVILNQPTARIRTSFGDRVAAMASEVAVRGREALSQLRRRIRALRERHK